jgi:hypothetical protein
MIDGQAVAVSTSAFAAFIGTAASFSGPFQDPRGAGFPEELHAGAYSVRLKHLTKGEAKLLGVACLDGAAPDSTVCPDVVYLRSTGTFGRPADEPTSVRVVQALVRATSETFAAGNMALFGERVIGNGSPEVHGSVRLLPCDSPPCILTLSSGIGIRNNYNGLVAGQDIIPSLPVVRCPGGTACAGADVETLEGSVHIRKAEADSAVAISIQSPGASVGQVAASTNGATGRLGKPTMDRVDLGRGCAPDGISPPCSDVVGANPANIYADRPIRSDDQGPSPAFPELEDRVAIGNAAYDRYAACSSTSCGSGPDFFIAHAFAVPALTLDSAAPTFRMILDCATTLCSSGGARVNGAIFSGSGPLTSATVAAAPQRFMLEWRGSDWGDYVVAEEWDAEPRVLGIYQCVPSTPCERPNERQLFSPGVPVSPSTKDPVAPVLIYVNGAMSICPGGCPGVSYRGHAIFLASSDISIDTNLAPIGAPNLAFPDQNLFTFYTPKDIVIGATQPRGVIGRFYAGETFRVQTASQIVGGVSAREFNLAQLSKFWQVRMPATVTALPGYGPQAQPARPSQRWEVREIRWKECAQRPVPEEPC